MDWDDNSIIEKSLKAQGLKRYRIVLDDLDKIIKTDTTHESITSNTSGGTSGRSMINDLDNSIEIFVKVEDPEIMECKELAKVIRTGACKIAASLQLQKSHFAKLTAMDTVESVELICNEMIVVLVELIVSIICLRIYWGKKRVIVAQSTLKVLEDQHSALLLQIAKMEAVIEVDDAKLLIESADACKKDGVDTLESFKKHNKEIKAFFDSNPWASLQASGFASEGAIVLLLGFQVRATM